MKKSLKAICFQAFSIPLCLSAMNYLHGQEPSLESGDFIFVDLDCGPTCEAIEKVSLEQFGVSGPRLSHVGILEKTQQNTPVVWEAWPVGGVRPTPLLEFLRRPHSRIYWARPQAPFNKAIPELLNKIRSFQSAPYDEFFLTGNSSYYCSEMIYEAWPEVFQLRPMYFGTPDSGSYLIWQNYYHQRWMSVPAAEPGISPLGIYLMGLQNGLFKLDQIQVLSEKK